MHRIFVFLVAVMMSTALWAKNEKTLVVTPTPKVTTQATEKKIASRLRQLDGTKKVSTDRENQEVTIVFDDEKRSTKDYLDTFKKMGYSVKIVENGRHDDVDATTGATSKNKSANKHTKKTPSKK